MTQIDPNQVNERADAACPIAVIMIALNEAHNMESVLRNLKGWAQEIFLVDSFSADDTVGISLRHGVHVVQRRFRGFGDQWNFALRELPITTPWTMKLDPDERLSDELKRSIRQMVAERGNIQGIVVKRRLWFMGAPLPVRQPLLRAWRTGHCRFSDVAVNEYPNVSGKLSLARGDLDHHDSPDLDHWLLKQNRYTTAEAKIRFEGAALAATPRVFGNRIERRMWLKRHVWRVPGRFALIFCYHWLVLGAWRAGRIGWIWSHLRTEVYRLIELKTYEMRRLGRAPVKIPEQTGTADARVRQYD